MTNSKQSHNSQPKMPATPKTPTSKPPIAKHPIFNDYGNTPKNKQGV